MKYGGGCALVFAHALLFSQACAFERESAGAHTRILKANGRTTDQPRFVNSSTSVDSATTSKSADPGTTGSVFTATQGPYLGAARYVWTKYVTPSVVGTVHVTVDQAHNTTYETTIYHTDYEVNGSHALLTRTDVNTAGTVTVTLPVLSGSPITVTYPTEALFLDSELTWGAVVPITEPGTYAVPKLGGTGPGQESVTIGTIGADGTCCFSSATYVPTPSHTPFHSDGFTDTADPSGWLYTLAAWDFPEPWTELGSMQISSMWAPQSIDQDIGYDGCMHTYCKIDGRGIAAPVGVLTSQAYLLERSTTTLSSSSTSKSSAAPKSSPTTEQASPTSSESSPAPAESAVSQQSTPSPEPSSDVPDTDSDATSESAVVSPNQPATSTQEDQQPTTADDQPATRTQQDQQATSTNGQPDDSTQPSQDGSSAEVSAVDTPQNSPDTAAPATSLPPTTVTTSKAVIAVGSSTITQQSDSNFVVGSQTLLPGSTITVGEGSSSTEVALSVSGAETIVQVGSSRSTLQDVATTITAAASPPPSTQDIVVGSVTISAAASSSALVVGSQTLLPGSSITVGSGAATTVVALRTSGSQTIVQVGTVESTLASQPAPESIGNTPVTVADVVASPTSSGAYIVDGQTLNPGSSITVGSGDSTTVVALRTSGSQTIVQVGTVKSTLASEPSVGNAPVTVGDVVASPTSSGAYVVDGQTLIPGSSITIGSGSSTTVVALETTGSATVLEVGTSRSTLSDTGSPTTSDVVFEGITLEPTSSSEYIVGTQTLEPGSSITVGWGNSKTVIALQTSGSETILRVGTHATTLLPQSATETTGVGGYIASGLGGGGQSSSDAQPSGSSTSTGIAQSNDAVRRSNTLISWNLACLILSLLVA